MIGLLGKEAAPDPETARRMLAAAPHRGSRVTQRALGSAIVGVATQEDHPDASVSTEGSPLIAALLGRIDNAAELAHALTTAGFPPRSRSDADLVVAGFQAWQDDAPGRMRGSFSGIVSDGATLWGFRDHIGFRPLFYRDDPRSTVAAAESRQVAIGAGIREAPDLEVLELMFYGRMPANTPAALKGVERLAQANLFTARSRGALTTRRYWQPERLLESARYSPADLQARFTELMAQAVTRTLSGEDVVLLSGGVDSPAVAAFAAPGHSERWGCPLGALSAVFPDLPAVDERPFIEMVTERYGIELHTFRPRARALDDVEEWCRLFASPIPILSVPEVADNHARVRALGYRTILTGDFAEFVFGSPMHTLAHLLYHGRWRALLGLLHAERLRGAERPELLRELGQAVVPGAVANWYYRVRGLDFPERIPDWLDARVVNQVPFRSDLLPAPHRRWREVQRSGLEGSTITIEADELCAARVGARVRRPFADVDLWEFFIGLRAETKFPDLRFKTLGKSLLRGKVPDAILDRRRKTVFDDHVMTQIDYPLLSRLFDNPRHPMRGVNYRRLAERVRARDFNRFDWHWAQDLARIHAFLRRW